MVIFYTQLTNSCKHWKTKKKPQKCGFIYFGSPNIAPCQPIIKPRRKNSINHIRFCRFANCSSAYSPCVPVGDAHENCVFIWCIRTNVGTLAHPVGSALTKIKNDPKVVYYFWQGVSCNSRTEFVHDLLQFGKDVKVFIDKQLHFFFLNLAKQFMSRKRFSYGVHRSCFNTPSNS